MVQWTTVRGALKKRKFDPNIKGESHGESCVICH
nr:MAG TPA: Diheme cytochrome c peroxidase [Caudoviricetes sp.]